MKLEEYEIDLIIETIQYRLENDELLELNTNIKEDLKDILRGLEDEYL
jgi:hypothetical protein